MATIFKRKRKVKLPNGKTVVKQSEKYYTRLTNADGIKRTIPLYRDKIASEQKAARLQKEIEQAAEGVIDKYRAHRKRPLSEHIVDFEKSLLAKGVTGKHASLVRSRVEKVFAECKAVFWGDMRASIIQTTISGLRKYVKTVETEIINGKKVKTAKLKDIGDISAQTYNFYLTAVKQFCRWMVQDQRAGESPVEHLKTINVRADRRHDRRSLEPDEVRSLLEATETAPERFGMTGHERALLYLLAVETGLRASELKSLTASSFDFGKNSVTVLAAYSKNRRQATLPLRAATSAKIRELATGKLPNTRIFAIPGKPADMLRADLELAGIPYRDETGKVADFQSLRHTFGTLLASSGVHPKTAQELMRHSDINLTMSRYTHTLRGQEARAVAGLPDLSLPSNKGQRNLATGTDDMPVRFAENEQNQLTPKWTPFLTPTPFSGYDRSAMIDTERDNFQENDGRDNHLGGEKLDSENNSLSANVIDKNQMRPAGLEPATCGLGNRCSFRTELRAHILPSSQARLST